MQKYSSVSTLPVAAPIVVETNVEPIAASPRLSLARRWMKTCPPLVMAGLGWIALMLFVAVFADFLAPYTYSALDLKARLPPLFFDLEQDPHQLVNQVGNPAYDSARLAMAEKMLNWRLRHADRSLTGYAASPEGLQSRL